MRRLLLSLCCVCSLTALAGPNTGPVPGHAESPPSRPRVEMVFALDTTSSMSGLIEGAKQKIWGIISEVAQGRPTPEIRVGLVAFRDKGDAYVTQVTNLSGDLDAVYAKLMGLRAQGGGDTPENVNQALADAVHRIEWSTSHQRALRVIFLVGDAPPQLKYREVPSFQTSVAQAAQKGIVVNAIRCGNDATAGNYFSQIAKLGRGEYLTIDQSGGMVAMATPYDEELAQLSRKMDETYVLSGADEERKRAKDSLDDASGRAAAVGGTAAASRATFRAKVPSAAPKPAAEADLVSTLERGDAEELEKKLARTEALPEPMREMSKEEKQKYVEGERKQLQEKMSELGAQRARYLAEQKPKKYGFDDKVTEMVREQAAEAAGLAY